MTSSNVVSRSYVKSVFNVDGVQCFFFFWSVSLINNYLNITLPYFIFAQKVIFVATLSVLCFTSFMSVINKLEIFLFWNEMYAILLIPRTQRNFIHDSPICYQRSGINRHESIFRFVLFHSNRVGWSYL